MTGYIHLNRSYLKMQQTTWWVPLHNNNHYRAQELGHLSGDMKFLRGRSHSVVVIVLQKKKHADQIFSGTISSSKYLLLEKRASIGNEATSLT